MSEAREIELEPIVDRVGEPDYVLIGADDPEGMLRHTEECRQRGYPFIADPSQQLAFGDGDLIRTLIDGAAILFSNEYESHLIDPEDRLDPPTEVLDRVGTQVTTLGADGVRIDRAGRGVRRRAGRPGDRAVEPTGVGDAFRAGFLGRPRPGAWATSAPPRSAACSRPTSSRQVGTQEYALHRRAVPRAGCAASYGDEAAADVEPHLRTIRP